MICHQLLEALAGILASLVGVVQQGIGAASVLIGSCHAWR